MKSYWYVKDNVNLPFVVVSSEGCQFFATFKNAFDEFKNNPKAVYLFHIKSLYRKQTR